MDRILAEKIIKASYDIKECNFDIESFTSDDLLEVIEYFGEVISLLSDDDVKTALRHAWKNPGSIGIENRSNINKLQCYFGL